ncbi:putative transcription initiation factor TFIID subunit 5 [Trichinella spiralis]|uniref:putative transcription initiation factor TFIID subunit 5 n=1 Tax=Trichinella spiralis TaxID=6334 RepID=UPI0001EFD020|nr:putative transcription initiation factor TFIID subunit 5 [Trichinella spiralis]
MCIVKIIYILLFCGFFTYLYSNELSLKKDFKITGDGFHRQLSNFIYLSSMNRLVNCSVVYRVTVPSGAYLDVDQMPASIRNMFYSYKPFFVEAPAWTSVDQTVLIESSKRMYNAFIFEDVIEFPIHFRYQKPTKGGLIVKVRFYAPDVLLRCLDPKFLDLLNFTGGADDSRLVEAPCNFYYNYTSTLLCLYLHVKESSVSYADIDIPTPDISYKVPVTIGLILCIIYSFCTTVYTLLACCSETTGDFRDVIFRHSAVLLHQNDFEKKILISMAEMSDMQIDVDEYSRINEKAKCTFRLLDLLGASETRSAFINGLQARSAEITDARDYFKPPSQFERDEFAKRKFESAVKEYSTLISMLKQSVSDRCHPELSVFNFTVYAAIFADFCYNDQFDLARDFLEKFLPIQECYYESIIEEFSLVLDEQDVQFCLPLRELKSNRIVVRLSRESISEFRELIKSLPLISDIVEARFELDTSDEPARSYETVERYRGYLLGEAPLKMMKTKVYSGIFKDQALPILADDSTRFFDIDGDSEKPKKKKSKSKDSTTTRKQKADPNAPAWGRIPFGQLSDTWKLKRHQMLSEINRKPKANVELRPTAIFYAVENSDEAIDAITTSEDCKLLFLGYSNSSITMRSLNEEPLPTLKRAEELESLNVDSDDIYTEMLEANPTEVEYVLTGHSGEIYSLSYHEEKHMLLSCSQDKSIRLWNLLTRDNLVAYHYDVCEPTDVQFSTFGSYFVSGYFDGAVCLWALDRPSPLRVMLGHYDLVGRVRFHPNCNYVASCSEDRAVRIWDLLNGQCVRLFTGHKASVQALEFSYDGRWLASGGEDGRVLVWDIGSGKMMHDFINHRGIVYSLAFTRDSRVLASGGTDRNIVIKSLVSQTSSTVVNDTNLLSSTTHSREHTFGVEAASAQYLRFSLRNVLFAFGGVGQ